MATPERSTPATASPGQEAAAEYLRALAPPFTSSLAECAVLARQHPSADRERVDAAIALLGLDRTGEA